MEISYKFTPKEIQKLSKFKNPSIVLDKNKIIKNGKYKIYLTKNMFNKLLEKGELNMFLLINEKIIMFNKEDHYLVFLKVYLLI